MRTRIRQVAFVTLVNAGALSLFVAWWEARSKRADFNHALVASPTEVWDALRDWASSGSLWRDIWPTAHVVTVGYVIGVALGVTVGIAVGVSPTVRAYAEPFLSFFNALPRILLIPFLVIWLGYGTAPRVILVVSVVMFVVIPYVKAGVLGLRSELVDNLRALGATPAQRGRHLYVPGIALWIVASARVAVGVALQAALLAEFFGSSSGLGAVVLREQNAFRPAMVFAAILVMILIALVVDRVLRSIERRVTRWMPARTE